MSAAAATTDVAWIALGSNVGHRGEALRRLRDGLQREGVRIEAESSEILTRPIGVIAQEDFHNQLVKLRAPEPWTPHHWLEHCKAAEHLSGRRETYRWGPRVADADIVLLGERGEITVKTRDLVVPHPGVRTRPYLWRLLDELEVRWEAGPPAAG